MNGVVSKLALALVMAGALALTGCNSGTGTSESHVGASAPAAAASSQPKADTSAKTSGAPTAAAIKKAADEVDTDAIADHADDSENWLTYGGGYSSRHFSALEQIDTDNVGKLGLAWSFNLGSTHHGVEAIPVVVGGVMYVTTPWNIIYALDATTGKKIWSYDPKTPRTIGYKGCCDVSNRGAAVYKGKVYEVTYDGRLIALDAATGKLIWTTDTLPQGKHHYYTANAAPLVADGKVVIGNGGAEYAGVRGYVSAYDAETGKLDWRWYTVPGNPDKPYENEAMKKAAKTWDPKTKYWTKGGGGTVWQSFSYDPELDMLYFGTGNADPWNQAARGGAKYHALYTASIVALDMKNGKYVWHYQTTPADFSDYDTDQDMTLATLEINDKDVPVIMNANKNGFFYVLDRRNGKFISAKNFVPQNWAKGYTDDGKVIPAPELMQKVKQGKPFESVPGPFAAHNWQASSYSPETGLYYIPAQHIPASLSPLQDEATHAQDVGGIMSGNGWNTGMQLGAGGETQPFGRLIAWNPITQKQAWKHDYPAPWNGGILSTAGDLVFQATADGHLVAFNAKSGKQLWQAKLGQGAIAAPMTYKVDGKQYVSIAVGWGGVAGQSFRATPYVGPGRVFTFAMGGDAPAPQFSKAPVRPFVTGVKFDPKDVKPGTKLYLENCAVCHGTPGANQGGSIPNLGHVDSSVIQNLGTFVFNGPFVSNGMPDFTGRLSKDDVTQIKAFIQATASQMQKKQEAAKAGDKS